MISTILGAIAGDVIVSVCRFNNVHTTSFPLFKADTTFTNDTMMTMAVVEAMLYNKDFVQTMFDYGNRYPNRGYGGRFAW
ncbi:MAG: hypothetical protein ACTTJI_05230 [Capnocytophaga sp.]|uniref:hypothetical protein n=1 Tax=Capnocytophaga sp. TaxID=44737 RepID=UPI003FA0944B